MQKTDKHPDFTTPADSGFEEHQARKREADHIRATKKVILGSSSQWRQRVLAAAGIDFDVIEPYIDEKAVLVRNFPHSPEMLTLNIAAAKASALLARISSPTLLITSDQVAVFKGEIREKPADDEEARRFLRSYRFAEVSTVTSVVVTDVLSRTSRHATDVARVRFNGITDAAIEGAIKRGDVLRSCGAFTIDDLDIAPFVFGIEGDGDEIQNRTSVDGLPLWRTIKLLASFGWKHH